MKRGPVIGIGIGIIIVIIVAVYAISGLEPMNKSVDNDQPQAQDGPSGDSGEGQKFKVTLDDTIAARDSP